MRALGFPAIPVLYGTCNRNGDGEKFAKGNFSAVYTASFTSMESVQVSFLGVFPSELESSSFCLISAFWLIQLF